jgi:uncharacterized protein YceK
MKRLLFGFSVLLISIGFSGCGDDNDLKVCSIIEGKGYTYQANINDILKSGAEVTNKDGNRIVTHFDARGTKVLDVILLPMDIEGKPSCYAVKDIYTYSNNKYVKNVYSFAMTLNDLYGKPEITFKRSETK